VWVWGRGVGFPLRSNIPKACTLCDFGHLQFISKRTFYMTLCTDKVPEGQLQAQNFSSLWTFILFSCTSYTYTINLAVCVLTNLYV
jgi:hypothetical protein